MREEEVNMMIQAHSGLVYKQLHKFSLIHDQEAESIAYWALYNAILNYDSSKGNKFSTVATVYIYNALGSYVRSLHAKHRIQTISYNNIAYSDDLEEHEFLDLLPAQADVEEEYIRKEAYISIMQMFDRRYNRLTNEKHKAIIKAWKDSDFTDTTKDIATKVGVSQSYVSQTINNFRYGLRKEMEENKHE